jgi:ATP-binding cassette subfamily F protein uup
LPAKIESLETEQSTIRAQLADGSIFAKDTGKAQQLLARDAQIEAELLTALERWENLSN